MKSLLKLLQSTDDLLAKAQSNLEKLGLIKSEQDVLERISKRIKPMTEKHKQLNDAIANRKEKIIKMLAELLILTGNGMFGFCDRQRQLSDYDSYDFRVKKDDQGFTFCVQGGRQCYDSKFLCTLPVFYHICESMIERITQQITDFINTLPSLQTEQSKEIAKIEELIKKVCDLSKKG